MNKETLAIHWGLAIYVLWTRVLRPREKKVTGSVSDSGWSHPVIAKLQISHTSVLKLPSYLPYRTSISTAHSIIGDSMSGWGHVTWLWCILLDRAFSFQCRRWHSLASYRPTVPSAPLKTFFTLSQASVTYHPRLCQTTWTMPQLNLNRRTYGLKGLNMQSIALQVNPRWIHTLVCYFSPSSSSCFSWVRQGRTVVVTRSLGDSLRALDGILARNKVKYELRLTERHEKKGVKRRRLTSERWRNSFANEVRYYSILSSAQVLSLTSNIS